MATTNSSYITLTADGSAMQCYTASPQGSGTYPAIMVFQEAFGVNHHIRDLCERFAEQHGAVKLVCTLHDVRRYAATVVRYRGSERQYAVADK
jgi:dienelactone hydrolase